MSDKATADVKAPAPAVVEKAAEKEAAGEDLNQREAKALKAQRAIDAERGYSVIDWKGVALYQSADGHTSADEQEIIKHVNERRVAAASPFIQGH